MHIAYNVQNSQCSAGDCVLIFLGAAACTALGFVYRFAAVYGFGKPEKSAAAAAITVTTQGEMCT